VSPSADYHAEPLETNLFEWHFTIRGPPAPSAYDGGVYHGRILLPPQYPLRPPAFRFLTPTGRFEVNREICLSISGHHEETWQPAWGVRTALVAIRSFMDTDAKGQIGGIECSKEAREKMAKESHGWKCPACSKSNAEIMLEREDTVREIEQKEGKRKEDDIPEELKLAYRDELGTKPGSSNDMPKDKGKPVDTSPDDPSAAPASVSAQTAPVAQNSIPPASVVTSRIAIPTRRTLPPVVQSSARRSPDRTSALIDTLIYAIVAVLLFMVLKRFAS
jgi:ubiquitin-conjugating enzyme E2 J1